MLLLFASDPLPPGLWLVKGIDRGRFGNGQSTSVSVDVTFERLAPDVPPSLEPSVLWSRYCANSFHPGSAPERFASRRLLIGVIAQLCLGDVCAGTRKVASLAQAGTSLKLNQYRTWNSVDFFVVVDEHPIWCGDHKTWQLISSAQAAMKCMAQYNIAPSHPQTLPSHRVPSPQRPSPKAYGFKHGNVEYILPALVILQAFYAVDSRLINALYNGAWQHTAEKLLVLNDDSDFSTDREPHTGPWTLVLQAGLPQRLVLPLALLWLNPEGRRQAELVHRRALEESRKDSRAEWCIDVDFPFAVNREPWTLGIEGLPLRAVKDSMPRFLITSLVHVTWPVRDQVIHWAVLGSAAKGDPDGDPSDTASDLSGWPAQHPVDGDPNALHSSVEDPDPSKPQNRFDGQAFDFVDPPMLVQRFPEGTRRSSGSKPSTAPSVPSPLVSAGTLGSRTNEATAPAVHTYREANSLCKQFERLLDALKTLQKNPSSSLAGFADVGPDDPHADYRLRRNDRACWSLLKNEHRRNGRMPATGWEVIRPKSRGEDRTWFSPYRRSVWVIRVRVRNRDLMLFEIEYRPGDTEGFRMIAVPLHSYWTWADVATAIAAIRTNEGTFTPKELQAAFGHMAAGSVQSHRHEYEGREKNLNLKWLADWLQRVATRGPLPRGR
ncbi:MAG: hypothetical protein EOO81_00570 [Oxalobacteraceae bacterium]|nr:MAG: hypothetical protein EOO81_00570 [Oxalobacteraceae bacterium]